MQNVRLDVTASMYNGTQLIVLRVCLAPGDIVPTPSAPLAGGSRDIRVLYRRLDPVVLPEDAPQHARAGDPERDRYRRQPQHRVDAGQEPHRPAPRLPLRRARLQRLVHLRDHHPLHRQPRQAGLHQVTSQHHRLHRHAQLLHGHVDRLSSSEVPSRPHQRRHPRVLQHHQDLAAVQADPALSRP